MSTIGMKTKSLALVFCGLVSLNLFATDLSSFEKRFEFERNEQGELEFVRDNSIKGKFSIRPYVQFIKSALLQEQALMSAEFDYDQAVVSLFEEDLKNGQNFLGTPQYQNSGQAQIILDSLHELKKIDVEEVFADETFNVVIQEFEWKLSDALLKLDPTVIAHAKDQDFFYQKGVTYQALTWGLNFAKKRLSSLPILNTASYVLVKVEELIRRRRQFHQNMLLHYLENVSAEELGLTHVEVNHLMSSIYESRIPWFAFWESRAAQANWDQYGVNKFFGDIRLHNNRFRRMRTTFDGVGSRLNYAFQEVVVGEDEVILNLFHTDHMFSQKLSIAHNKTRPNLIMRKRMVIQLAELGLSFVPLPSFIKGFAEDFMKSFYKEQSLTEGALYGHFEGLRDEEGMNMVKRQILNPFETL